MYGIASQLKSLQKPIAILDSHLEKRSKRKQLIDKTFKDNYMFNFNPTALSKSKITTIIYLNDEAIPTEADSSFENRLKHFMEILNVLKNTIDGRKIQLLFVSMTATSPIHEAATELFSLLLHSWHSSYGVRVKMVELDGSFNDGTCGSFDPIVSFIKSNESNAEDSLQVYAIMCEKKDKVFQMNKEKRILFSTYFTHNKQFVRPYRENSFQFVKGFVVTAKRYNAHIVLYYDQIDPSYKKRLLTFYPNIEFIQYTGNFYKKSINDARFFIMYDYMKKHPEIDRIILQDLRDGIYLTDPFEVMELAGDYLYVGMDVSFRRDFIGYKICEKNHKDLFTRPRPYPMMNAGTLGGTRHMVMDFLEELIKSFNEIFPLRIDCNMDTVDYVAHKYFKDVLFTGYPFQGYMQIGLASPPGIAIRHKRTKYDM